VPLNPEAAVLAAKINKDMGEGAVIIASEMTTPPAFTTGDLGLDISLGGGWPGNQWCEVIGMESHGKTFVVLKTIAANQSRDPEFTTLWIAAEPYDTEQASALGVDNDRVVLIPTQDMTYAYEKILEFAEQRAVDCVVIDSYPAMIAAEEEEKSMDEAVVALGARFTGKFFRKAGHAWRRNPDGSERPILGLFINQFRDKIGGFSPQGTPRTTPGGNAKNYAFYVRAEVKRDEFIEEALPGKNLKVKVGQVIKITTIKNKAAAPRQVTSIDAYFRDAPLHGFKRGDYDKVKTLVIYGLLFDVIVRRGAYYDIGDVTVKSKDAMVDRVREDLDLQEYIEREVRQIALHTGPRSVTEADIETASNEGTRKVTRRRSVDEEDVA
jgi:recombination protein RecA